MPQGGMHSLLCFKNQLYDACKHSIWIQTHSHIYITWFDKQAKTNTCLAACTYCNPPSFISLSCLWFWWNAIAGWGSQPSNVLNKDHGVQTARKAVSGKGCAWQIFTPRAVSLPPNFWPAVFQAQIKPSWLWFFLAVWIILGCWWGFGNCDTLWNGGEREKQCGKICLEGWLFGIFLWQNGRLVAWLFTLPQWITT